MNQNFMKSKLPKVYNRNFQNAYLDPIREKLIYVTPEETVRQHVISYLLKNLKVPKNLICVEEPLKHYGIKTKDRADIIIDSYDEETEKYYPLAVIECKAPEIYLDDYAHKQMFGYAEKLGCDYCVLTNGEETFCFYNGEKIDELPTYEEMLQGKYSLAPVEEPEPRLSFDELETEYQKYFYREKQPQIGDSTPEEFSIPLANFVECLLDTSHKMPEKNYKIFRLIEDYGIRDFTTGASAGFGKASGQYRSFLVEYNGNATFVSISTTNYFDGRKTCIFVAVDTDEGKPHRSLSMDIDNFCEVRELPKNISDAEVEEKLNAYIATLPPKPTGSNLVSLYRRIQWEKEVKNFEHKLKFNPPQFVLYHNGKITSGDKGALKVDGLRKIVAEKYPEIIDGKNFYLGTLTHDRLWYLDDEEVMKVVENLISYALIRDDYRAMF